jgi:hypothetical protein
VIALCGVETLCCEWPVWRAAKRGGAVFVGSGVLPGEVPDEFRKLRDPHGVLEQFKRAESAPMMGAI